MKKNDDVLFEVSQGVEEATADLAMTDNAPSGVPVPDDIPVATTEAEATAGTVVAAEDAAPSRRSAWKALSSEDLPAVSLREILGGDYLIGSFLRHNIAFILLMVIMGIVYISNRYGAQQEIIEEESLRHELLEKKNYALTRYAQLTQQTRQSSLEARLKSLGDSTLLSAKEPPFIIIRK